MKYLYILLILLLVSCDEDPTLSNDQNQGDDDITTIDDKVRLSSIQIAENTASNIVTNIDIVYDNDNLISEIVFSGQQSKTYQFQYAPNNQVINYTKIENQSTSSYSIEYDENIIISSNVSNPNQIQQFEIDNFNRVDEILSRTTNSNGSVIQENSEVFDINANFNIERITYLENNNTTGFSDFTYELNDNPFKDMNDIIRLLVFKDFIPSSRFLPLTQEEYDTSTGPIQLVQEMIYTYNLNSEGMPVSREISTTNNGISSTSYNLFSYL
ncbi:hypothetical protein [Nonlabens sp. MIC269]|uniref:hypothetical protein n=1 Tax=Nonlabens sp. MIC269 TaxID=1476901 RepID=UPI0012FB9D9A|nr:hypothetical protein [Nonlabens sp. MIC269]